MRSAALAGSLGLLMFLRAGMALAQAAPLKPGTRTISVSGHGEVKAKPDLMIVSFAIDSKAPSGARCTEIQTGKTQKLVAALKAKLGADAGIETSDYSLNQSYEPGSPEDTQTGKPPTVWIYKATITAAAENMANLGSLIDAGMAAGASDVAGSGFQFFPVNNAGPSNAKPIVHGFNAMVHQYDGLSAGRPMKQMPSVSLEVETRGATADQAVRLGAEKTGKVEKALKAKLGDQGELTVQNFGILQTSPSQPQPINSYRPPPPRKIFVARTAVTVKTEKLDLLGALIEAGMENGADQLTSVSFTLSDAAASDDAAIAAASKEAETKARTAANSMAVKLGKILSISVNAQVRPQTLYGPTLMAAAAIGTTSASSLQRAIMPVLPRELGVGAEVNAVYEIQ
ncbi:MAG TPA: SIMPL domain-containing protein [Candidatus Binataceae bacterium]|nr:SIMPL domain-containing protein [Candidatus Binataceae bacterium]